MKKRSSMVMISSVPDKRESFLAEGEVCFVEFKACSQEGSCFKYILKTEKKNCGCNTGPVYGKMSPDIYSDHVTKKRRRIGYEDQDGFD
jgi:hypothetical protein